MFTYVIRSLIDGSEYVGMSDAPSRGLLDHNRGDVHSTKNRGPSVEIYREECENRLDARVREKYLKSAAGRRFRRTLRAISSAG